MEYCGALMLIWIPNVLTADEARHVRDVVARGTFVDGQLTAGVMGRDIKKNLELQRSDNKPTEIDRIVMNRLLDNSTFQDFAMPKQVVPPIFSKYEVGMEYGTHVDSPMIGQTSLVRSDLSLTLFLSDPTSYDGGELSVQTGFGEQEIKLAAGDAVVYPSTSLHRVKPVTRGERIVALSWVQSFVQDEGIRDILYDLTYASRRLSESVPMDASPALPEIRDKLYRAYANLMRRYTDV